MDAACKVTIIIIQHKTYTDTIYCAWRRRIFNTFNTHTLKVSNILTRRNTNKNTASDQHGLYLCYKADCPSVTKLPLYRSGSQLSLPHASFSTYQNIISPFLDCLTQKLHSKQVSKVIWQKAESPPCSQTVEKSRRHPSTMPFCAWENLNHI